MLTGRPPNWENALGLGSSTPARKPVVTAAIITVPPGSQTGWHSHEAPLFAWMLDGALTIDYGPDGTLTYAKGEAPLEAFCTPHNGQNRGTEPARLLAVFMGAEEVANTVIEPQ